MNTQQLNAFVQVADNLSFVRAAEALHLSQPAVTHQITSLENELGTQLFERTKRTVRLTSAGVYFYEDAQELLHRSSFAKYKLQNYVSARITHLNIGCGSFDLAVLTRLLRAFSEQVPQVHPTLRTLPHNSLVNRFYYDEIDVLFRYVNELPLKDTVRYVPLGQTPVCVGVPESWPEAGQASFGMHELTKYPIVSCNELPPDLKAIQEMASQKMNYAQVYYCKSIPDADVLVASGLGYMLCPGFYRPTQPGIRLVPVRDVKPLQFGLFCKAEHARDDVKRFVRIAQENFPKETE